MDFEINRPVSPQPLTAQEIKLSKLDLALYLGQALKAVVLTPLNDGEVTININGQKMNAKTSHPFTPGETLDVKVVNTEDEIVLQVQQQAQNASGLQKTILQNALMQALPKQAAPGNLLENLAQLVQYGQLAQNDKLPPNIMQQIKTLLATIPALSQLPQQLSRAINQSGVFLESALLQWQPGMPTEPLQTDFKAQYLKLLNSLPIELKNSLMLSANTAQNANPSLQKEPLPLPGAIPQPLHKDAALNMTNSSPEAIQTALHEQVSQALSRITANQVTHLTQNALMDDNKTGFLIMMDIPIKTPENDIDVIPLMIKQRKPSATEPDAQWSMSFAVSLSELGDMQGTVSMTGNEVSVKINAEKQEAIDTLQHYQGDMESLLRDLGLNLSGLHIKLGLESNQIQTENLHLLDIRI